MKGDQPNVKVLLDDAEVGLAVQHEQGAPPDYAVVLYRLYLAEADLELELDGQALRLRHGQLLTLSPGEVVVFDAHASVRTMAFHHNFFCVRVQRDEVYCDGVVFNRVSGLPVVAFPEDELDLLRSRFEEVSRILSRQGPFTQDRAVNALRALLLHAADFKLRGSEVASALVTGPARLSPLVLAFQNLVETTFTERKDASFYCETLGVTSVTLGRRVKEELGQTVMQVVNERVAIEARVALRSGERSVKEVAIALGFQDPLYFSRFFKKQFGRPPSQYFQNAVEEGG